MRGEGGKEGERGGREGGGREGGCGYANEDVKLMHVCLHCICEGLQWLTSITHTHTHARTHTHTLIHMHTHTLCTQIKENESIMEATQLSPRNWARLFSAAR